MTVLKNSRGNTSGDPHELLELICPCRDRNALRRREEAKQDVNLLLLDQAHSFIDGDLGLALRVRIDRLDLIALYPALIIEICEHDLGAERMEIGATGCHRAAVIVDHPDLDLLRCFVGCGYSRAKQQRRSEHPACKAGASPEEHRSLPEGAFLLVFVARDEVITSAWLIAVKLETLVRYNWHRPHGSLKQWPPRS